MRIGVVMEGGGMRGLYTSGVLAAMAELQLPITDMIGVSAGALYGINYPAGQHERVPRYLKRYAGDHRFMGLRSLISTGNIVNAEFAYYKVPMKLDPFDEKAFEESGVKFTVVATDVETGKADYIDIKNGFEQMEALRATSALPFASKPVEYEGKKYLDGGLSDSIPVDYMLEQGCDRVILILTRDGNYRKKLPGIAMEKMTRAYYRKYPRLADSILLRPQRYNRMLEHVRKLEEDGSILVIRPSEEITVGRLEKDPEKLQEVFDLGLADGKSIQVQICKYCGL